MNKIFSQPRTLVLLSIIIIAAIARLFPHPWNCSPIAAMALFGGVYFKDKRTAFIITILALIVSDMLTIVLVNGRYTSLSQSLFSWMELAIILSFSLTVLLGILIRKKTNIISVAGVSIISSTLFFLITNFACWPHSTIYPQTFQGLLLCYDAGLEFYRNNLIGDLVYSGILFGSFYLVRLKFPVLAKQ